MSLIARLFLTGFVGFLVGGDFDPPGRIYTPKSLDSCLGPVGPTAIYACDDPCEGSSDPCCRDPCACDNCCPPGNPCCGSSDPCCNRSNPCCGSSDPCCGSTDPCCGSTDPCCSSTDLCCGSTDPCCPNTDPCDAECGDPCECLDCDDNDPCTADACANGACVNQPICAPEQLCCEGTCCNQQVPPEPCCGPVPSLQCCGAACCYGICINDDECCTGKVCPSPSGIGDICCDECDSCSPTTGCCSGAVCPNGVCCADDDDVCTLDQCECVDPPDCTAFTCSHPPACYDNNPCTSDICTPAACGDVTCTFSLLTDVPCPDDGNECTDDICVNGFCTHPWWPDCTACSDDWCIGNVCVPSSCTFWINPETACPGSMVELSLFGTCSPACDTMSFSMIKTPQYLTVGMPAPIDCDGTFSLETFTVTVSADAPPGDITFQVLGTTSTTQCQYNATVTVFDVDLAFENVADEDEETVGGFVCTGSPPGTPLHALTISADPLLTGTVSLTVGGAKGNIQIYTDVAGTNAVPLFNQTWNVSQLPVTLYVDGFVVSGAHRDIEFRLTYNGSEGPCEDVVKLTVLETNMDSLTFTSDHALMLDNETDFEPTGTLYAEPEWDPNRTPASFPISHTMGQPASVTVTFTLNPANVPAQPITLTNTGPAGFHFNTTDQLLGGTNTLTLTSTDTIAPVIQELTAEFLWDLAIDGRTCFTDTSGPHTVYVTVGTPRDTTDPKHVVTMKRMERAVQQAGAANSLNPHAIVEEVVAAQGNFALVPPLPNAWNVPDVQEAACESIIRFAGKVVKMIDLPGTFEHKHIYVIETAADTAIEVPNTHAGLNQCQPNSPPECVGEPRFHASQPWSLSLIDADGGCNALEAVGKFTACGESRYYAGGVPGAVFTNARDVLTVFDTLSWVEFVGVEQICTPREATFNYPGSPGAPPIPPCP